MKVTVPSTSYPRTASGLASSRRIRAPHAAPASASGTLNQNTQCQEIATSAPPSTGPSTSPIAATIVLAPIARPELLLGEGVGDERGGVGEDEGRADALQHAPEDQHRRVGGEAGAERGEREDDEAADVGALAPEQVAEAPGGQHQHRRGDQVGEDHPDEREQARVQRALEVRAAR